MRERLAEIERQWDRVHGRPERDFAGMSAEEILFSEPIHPPRPRRQARVRERQVSVKLTADEHRELKRAANRYSAPTSTFARILLVRATKAVLGDE